MKIIAVREVVGKGRSIQENPQASLPSAQDARVLHNQQINGDHEDST